MPEPGVHRAGPCPRGPHQRAQWPHTPFPPTLGALLAAPRSGHRGQEAPSGLRKPRQHQPPRGTGSHCGWGPSSPPAPRPSSCQHRRALVPSLVEEAPLCPCSLRVTLVLPPARKGWDPEQVKAGGSRDHRLCCPRMQGHLQDDGPGRPSPYSPCPLGPSRQASGEGPLPFPSGVAHPPATQPRAQVSAPVPWPITSWFKTRSFRPSVRTDCEARIIQAVRVER